MSFLNRGFVLAVNKWDHAFPKRKIRREDNKRKGLFTKDVFLDMNLNCPNYIIYMRISYNLYGFRSVPENRLTRKNTR